MKTLELANTIIAHQKNIQSIKDARFPYTLKLVKGKRVGYNLVLINKTTKKEYIIKQIIAHDINDSRISAYTLSTLEKIEEVIEQDADVYIGYVDTVTKIIAEFNKKD